AWPWSQLASNATSPATTTPSSQSPGGNGGGGTSPFGGSGGSASGGTEGAGGPSDVSAIASKVDPAVVDVNSTFNYQGAEGAGTGIVLTSTGLVLTNNHVIDGATKLSVTDVGNGETYPATVVGYDNTHDVALLQLQGASGLTTAKLAPSSQSMGEAVVAIGNAGGTGGTPTSAGGSITALHQSITANDELDGGSEQLSGLIEVNANIEAGDSGGPLVNASGEVIGMDTAASESFAFSSEGNQGFAIPLSAALAIARQIESGHGNATVHVGATGFLGLIEYPSGNRSFLGDGAPTVTGVDIETVVPGSPAQEAGIAADDVVTAFDGHAVSTPQQLEHLMVAHSPGNKVTVTWVGTTGQSHTTTITLVSGPPS
ncbi:MAG TPA: trypsin-like peptidase domain-containing protein, partial [Acidimicrobiales bacterium]|nr:trypsin-like peptidase domain-containing protein [Acidimicrobiales bacterium]